MIPEIYKCNLDYFKLVDFTEGKFEKRLEQYNGLISSKIFTISFINYECFQKLEISNVDLLILEEGQNLRDEDSCKVQNIKDIKRKFRICVTGGLITNDIGNDNKERQDLYKCINPEIKHDEFDRFENNNIFTKEVNLKEILKVDIFNYVLLIPEEEKISNGVLNYNNKLLNFKDDEKDIEMLSNRIKVLFVLLENFQKSKDQVIVGTTSAVFLKNIEKIINYNKLKISFKLTNREVDRFQ